jgi:hypothetical protein
MPKKLSLIPKNVAKNIEHFSLSQKYRILGSNSIRGLIYPSDFDVEVKVPNETRSNTLAKHLQNKVKTMKDSIFIELKCGLDHRFVDGYENAPNAYKIRIKNANTREEKDKLIRDLYVLRWSKKDVLRGKIELIDGMYKSLADCLEDNSIIKLDLIIPIGDTYAELGEVYKYRQDKETFDDLESALENDVEEYKGKEKLKALKRLFSILKLAPTENKKHIKELEDFFNSEVGYANKIRSDLMIVLTLLENGKTISQLSPFIEDLKVRLGNIARIKVELGTKKDIEDTIERLRLFINHHSEEVVKRFI